MQSISVFCGSSMGSEEIYKSQANLLGQTLAKRDIQVVYGGANVGLMSALADGVLISGGKIIGIIPRFLKSKEIAHKELTKLILVDSMHERKTKMNELSDGVIALPGGYGTLDEFFEMLTWGQLGLHKKPVALLNIDGFYDPLYTMIQTMVNKGFLKEAYREMLIISSHIDELLDKMNNYIAPTLKKWNGLNRIRS